MYYVRNTREEKEFRRQEMLEAFHEMAKVGEELKKVEEELKYMQEKYEKEGHKDRYASLFVKLMDLERYYEELRYEFEDKRHIYHCARIDYIDGY